jgi:tetratricopeptide (TPR) repeat protein
MSTKFHSEGFDLSAGASNNSDAIVYEIGGGISTEQVTSEPSEAANDNSPTLPTEPTAESERLKELGNDHFRQGNHLDAYDYYTDAIEAAPYGEGVGLRGEELLRLREEFDEAKRQRNAERHRLEMEKRRGGDTADNKQDDNHDKDENAEPDEFDPPRHLYGHKLAVYHANRAASLLHMNRLDEAIDDCTISTLYNPVYTKAYIRRSTAHERNGDTESALLDMQTAYKLQPVASTKKQMDRLEEVERVRLEKLKEETMGKLKDLGNSILGNFGLSLDNFQAVQDPKTGGYSISFNQNK